MDDKVKLIIEIPKEVFEARKIGEISPWVTVPILDAVQNGIPLENVIADIKNCEIRHDFRIAEKDMKSRELMHGIFSDVFGILANMGKAESIDPNDLTHIFDGVTEIPKDAFKGWTTEKLLEQIRAESEEV